MATKHKSTSDVVARWETVHPGQKFQVKEFEGENGEKQLAVLNSTTNTVCVQFEGEGASDKAFDAATEILAESKVVPAKEAVDDARVESPRTEAEKELAGPVSADEAWKDLPKNDRGQVEINEDGAVVGTEGDKSGTVTTNPQAAEKAADK